MKAHAKIDPRLVVDTFPVKAKNNTTKVVTMSCVPTPTAAQNIVGFWGFLNTSPLINFHPDYEDFGENLQNDERSYYNHFVHIYVPLLRRSHLPLYPCILQSHSSKFS